MVEIFGKFYFIDLDALTDACKTGTRVKDDDGNESFEINIFMLFCVREIENKEIQKKTKKGLSGLYFVVTLFIFCVF